MRVTRLRSSILLSSITLAAFAAIPAARTEPVTLPAGVNVSLIVQHHVNSGYTPAGSNVYFRVAHDVIAGDHVLIAKDSLVTGKMAQATERGMVGRAGMMLVSVDSVTGVDGTLVPVDADLSKQGRSRGWATAGWTLFWGLPGLITKGVNPYMEKGDVLQAVVLTATAIDPEAAPPEPSPVDLGPELAVTQHQWARQHPNGVKQIDIERKDKMESVGFSLALPPELADPVKALESLRLYRVDGVAVPEEVKPVSVKDGAAVFEAWSIARYCRDGSNNLLFVGTDAGGRPFHASRDLKVEIKKKQKS